MVEMVSVEGKRWGSCLGSTKEWIAGGRDYGGW